MKNILRAIFGKPIDTSDLDSELDTARAQRDAAQQHLDRTIRDSDPVLRAALADARYEAGFLRDGVLRFPPPSSGAAGEAMPADVRPAGRSGGTRY